MTILATEAQPDGIKSGGVRPLIEVAREAHDASTRTLADGGGSGGQRGRVEELERSKLTKAIGLRIDIFEEAKPTAGADGVIQVA
jgi:hypothetical protein